MILALVAKGKKRIACAMLALIYFETIIPSYALAARRPASNRISASGSKPLEKKKPMDVNPFHIIMTSATKAAVTSEEDLGGPTQPESQGFHSVNSDNMVNLFTGDFNYSIPLLDVGGYPLAIGYSSGISMDQEASWVGLGWDLNPGAITRNLRGLPDEFNGTDSITKTMNIKDNTTIGATAGYSWEIGGSILGFGASAGVLYNTYRGIGLESSFSASLNSTSSSKGPLSGGLSFNSSTQEGFSISPSISYAFNEKEAREQGGFTGQISTSLSYNTRAGLKALQFSGGLRQYEHTGKDNTGPVEKIGGTTLSSQMSFAYPAFSPTINQKYTSYNFTVTLQAGSQAKILHPGVTVSGYISRQYIDKDDQVMRIPAYGYMNYQNGAPNPGALLDYNREREIPYREKPLLQNIAVPVYTYDVFSMTGEGTGGAFRAYRSDIGYVSDHRMKTKDLSGSLGVDLGVGDISTFGFDPAFTVGHTETGPWKTNNPLAKTVAFTKSDKEYEAFYFRNPGEKAINNRSFYDAIGGDYVVAPKLYQSGGSSFITTTNVLSTYDRFVNKGEIKLTTASAVKHTRDKRTQVISSLSAGDADVAGFTKYIENYTRNNYPMDNCNPEPNQWSAPGTGLWVEWFGSNNLTNKFYERLDEDVNFDNVRELNDSEKPDWYTFENGFCMRWTGYIKAPATGEFRFHTNSDDGAQLKLEDWMLIEHFGSKPTQQPLTSPPVYLEKDHVYRIAVLFNQYGGAENGKNGCWMHLTWDYPGQSTQIIPTRYLYPGIPVDTFALDSSNTAFRELRVNNFRKNNHLSELTVLNNDGKRYVYGLPVYNLKQKEVTFSVDHANGNPRSGMVKYESRLRDAHYKDDTPENSKGNDHYFSSEETPPYAHSFLLTAVLSPDYVDITGNGVSADDIGDAVKFNYTKMAGQYNPYEWRTPYSDSATYNEGSKTDNRDDKGSYIYGKKELWYLNSIESKNMIATFKLGDRKDLAPIDEKGDIDTGHHQAQRLEEINLYTKAAFKKYGTHATPVKTVHFQYSYELCRGINGNKNDYGKLTLKRIWFTYNGNQKGQKNPYVFRYHATNPRYNTSSYDRWGNYKDAAQNPGSQSGNIITNAEYPYAIQDSATAASNAAAWTLDTIIQPSGARMAITYESDDYGYVQNRRAAQMMNVAGFSYQPPTSLDDLSNRLYNGDKDNFYIAINVPQPVTREEIFGRYLEKSDTVLYFRFNVKMPADKYGSGYEYVSGYARLDQSSYGVINDGNTIWLKVQGMNDDGGPGAESPLTKTALQYLRLNLPSKAYPGSDVGADLSIGDAVQLIFSLATNIKEALGSFEGTARHSAWASQVDLARAFVRLDNPSLKKYGGGLRVKRIVISDNWNAMTGKTSKESTYGTEYSYTTTKNINGKDVEISSGVAVWEPVLGTEENPWHLPLEYRQQTAPLAPTNMGYVEFPLGESLFPAPSVGYSKVSVKSTRTKNTRSANGHEEYTFFTAYDYPTFTDYSPLDASKKLRYRTPLLANLLQINAAYHLVLSQGFKVELNDMHGKPRSHAVFPEMDTTGMIVYTENFYHTTTINPDVKRLNNTVLSISAQGEIDTAALIGKDVELMMDMREQRSNTWGATASGNLELFTFGAFPIPFPSFFFKPVFEENLFRSVAATKVINRHGILDSVVAIDKGSKVVTANLLYDGETGDPVLTAVQNEFGDSLYQFNYPAGWVYDGMSGAYKNIGFIADSVNIQQGRILTGLTQEEVAQNFTPGDEILAYSRNAVAHFGECSPLMASFRSTRKLWVVDNNVVHGGLPQPYFIDEIGTPYSGEDLVLRVIRSGRRNIAANAGTVTMLLNPLKRNATTGKYNLVIDKDSKIIDAAVTEFKQSWQVEDNRLPEINCAR